MSKTCIVLTDQAYGKLIEWNRSTNTILTEEAYHTKDGDWAIPLSPETKKRLLDKAFEGETPSDVIERLIGAVSGRN